MFQKTKQVLFAILAAVVLWWPGISLARENVTDWYIKDFDSQIVVNKDSSLDITETIVADCGRVPDKHGIFRTLPTRVDIAGNKVAMPVELVSITDEKGKAYKYTTTTNTGSGTLTWKIGDPDRTVQGVNVYRIQYKVKNTIRFADAKFDELYWNLSGNFWDLEIDNFHAALVFPEGINSQNATVDYYTGTLGSKDKSGANYQWTSPKVLEFASTRTMGVRQGITASVIFPKNIVAPYQSTFGEKFGLYFFGLIPLAALALCYALWRKYGDDPDFDQTVIAQYEVPDKMGPLELGMLMKNGRFDNALVTAEIIFFATQGLLTIKEVEEKILFFTSKDYELTRVANPQAEGALSGAQQQILKSVFRGNNGTRLSTLKNNFYKDISKIKKMATVALQNKGLIVPLGLRYAVILRVVGGVLVWLTYVTFIGFSPALGISVGVAALIFFAFSFVMPKRTLAGAQLNWQIAGFKLFMETVDKDRAAFYEKENMFEKCLPYAIVFGMVKEWTKRMQEIYGAEYFATHAPLWYAGNLGAFDANNFVSTIDNLSSQIAANTSAPTGSGGAGGSGGGGGGGGGGGW